MSSRALCVGINVYKNYPQATLHGCVNDANDMKAICTKWLHFGPNDTIETLTDAQATKANIMTHLKTIVADARRGKVGYIVFSMSSHGTQITDVSHDEPDGLDEAFCPHDLAQIGSQWDKNHLIVDDELHELFVTLPSNVLLEVWLDTCHSGTGLKAIDMLLDRKPKFLTPSVEEFNKHLTAGTIRGLARMIRETKLEKNLPNQILWAGCKDTETSADTNIGGVWHGAFTYFFKKEIDACHNTLSRTQLLNKVRNDLKVGHYTQTPQLECPATDKQAHLAKEMAEVAMA